MLGTGSNLQFHVDPKNQILYDYSPETPGQAARVAEMAVHYGANHLEFISVPDSYAKQIQERFDELTSPPIEEELPVWSL